MPPTMFSYEFPVAVGVVLQAAAISIGLKFIPHLCCANNSQVDSREPNPETQSTDTKKVICSLSDNFDALRAIGGAGCVIIYRNLLGCGSG